jgi:streptomycin 6-kinase
MMSYVKLHPVVDRDPVAIWEWGIVERLSSGLLCTRIHLQPLGRHTLRAVEAVAGLTID